MSQPEDETSDSKGEPGPPKRRLPTRRRLVWLGAALVVLAIAIRVALPEVIRRVAVDQADKALVGRVDIENVDLAVLAGRFTLRGVRVQMQELPSERKAALSRGMAWAQPPETVGQREAEVEPPSTATPPAALEPKPEAAPAGADPALAKDAATAKDPPPDKVDAGAPAASAPAPAAHAVGGPGTIPIFRADALTVDIAWRPLFRKLVEVESIYIERFDVHVDRDADGALIVPDPVPPSVPAEPEPPQDEEAKPWGVLIQQLGLHDGRLGFRDYAVGDPPQELHGSIPNLNAKRLALLITDQSVEPGTLALDADLLGGELRLESDVVNTAAGPGFKTHLVLTGLPIGEAMVYIPRVGWSDLTGLLDLDVVHEFESSGAHTLTGTSALRDLSIHIAGLERPSLDWKKLTVELDKIDVTAQHAAVKNVTLEGAHVIAVTSGPEPFPVMRGLLAEEVPSDTEKTSDRGDSDAETETKPEPKTEPDVGADADNKPGSDTATGPDGGAGAESDTAAKVDDAREVPLTAPVEEAAEPSKPRPAATADEPAEAESRPWTWEVAKVAIRDTFVHTVGGDASLDIGVKADVANVASTPNTRSTLDLELSPGAGKATLTGDFSIDPPGFDGKLGLDELAIPPLSSPVATPVTRLLREAVAEAELQVAVGNAPGAPKDGARVAGTIAVAGLAIVGDDEKTFSAKWRNLAIDIREILAPGVLAATGSAPAPVEVSLASFTLVRPEVVITRTAEGIALPRALGGGEADAESSAKSTDETNPDADQAKPDADQAKPDADQDAVETKPADEAKTAGAAEAPEQKTADAGASSGGPVDAKIANLQIEKMRVIVTDKTVKPVYRATLEPIDLAASDVRWPGPAAKGVELTAQGLEGAKLSVTGDVAPGGSQLTAKVDGLPLEPLNPYAVSTGYGVDGGTFALDSKIKLRADAYEAENKLVVHKLQVTGAEGESKFETQFGMPLSLALGLMTDLQGNIVLNVPVAGDRGGTRVAIGKIIRDTLARAILNAATSPLKLIGAVANIGDKPASLTPQPIAFRAGTDEIARGQDDKIDQLAKLLASSQSIVLMLRPETSDEDRRYLAEQKLRVLIEEESGFFNSIGHIGERAERNAAREVLVKRSEGEKADIPKEYEEWFETQVKAQKVGDDELRALAKRRAETVQTKLIEAKTAPERLVVEKSAPEDLSARSMVTVALGTSAGGANTP